MKLPNPNPNPYSITTTFSSLAATRSLFRPQRNKMSSMVFLGAMALGVSTAVYNNMFGSGPSLIPNDDAPPVEGTQLRTSGNLMELVEMAEAFEQDPLPSSFEVFEKGIKDRAARENNGVVTLQMVKEQARAQTNALEGYTMEIRMVIFEFAFTQSAKTNLMLFTMWKAGLQGIPSFVFAFNRTGERKRFVRSLGSITKIIKQCASNLNMDYESLPKLKITGDDYASGSQEFVRDVENFYFGGLNIPVFVVMSNDKKVTSVQQTFRDASRHIQDDIDEDGNRKKKALMILEEADLSVKGPGTSLYRALNERNCEYHLMNEGPNYVIRDGFSPRTVLRRNVSMTDGFTSIVVITATPQVFGAVDGLFEGRNARVFKSKPSKNYWSYVGGDWVCKMITTRVAEDYHDMIADMVSSRSLRRHGLVCISGKGGTARCIDQQELAQREAARYPGIVTSAWDGKGVHVYTKCPRWITKFRTSNLFTGMKICDLGVVEFIGKKVARKEEVVEDEDGAYRSLMRINSYPGLVTYMESVAGEVESLRGGSLTHTVLFAFNMAQRSTPIKGYTHKWGLTDMFLKMTGVGGHDEARIQAAGRVNAVDDLDPSVVTKTMWGPAEDLNKLRISFERLSFFLEKMSSGQNTTSLSRTLREGLEGAADGSTFHDASNVSKIDHGGVSRSTVMVGAVRAHKDLKETISNKKMRVTAPRIVPDFTMSAPVREINQPVAPVAQVAPSSPASDNPTPEEAWESQKDSIARAMKEVVVSSETPVTIRIMADRIEGECHFHNSNGFTMEVFVNTICVNREALDKAGLDFGNNVFSLKNKDTMYVTREQAGRACDVFDKMVSWYSGRTGWARRNDFCKSEESLGVSVHTLTPKVIRLKRSGTSVETVGGDETTIVFSVVGNVHQFKVV